MTTTTRLIAGAVAALMLLPTAAAGAEVPVTELARRTHFHGIAVDPADPDRIRLATHHGFYVVRPDGMAEQVSRDRHDFMGFSPHPSEPDRLFASGHPAGGGNLGVMQSTDGGRSWTQIARGAGGPVDFHQMDVSAADPNVLYGAYGGRLQTSRDGGRSWSVVGPAPDGLIGLTASARDPETLYAGTQTGLAVSRDGGRSWQPAHVVRRPATMVHATPQGAVYAYMVGTGLLRAEEPGLAWKTVGADLGDDAILHLAVHPTDPARLYAVAHGAGLIASRDGGASWAPLGAGT